MAVLPLVIVCAADALAIRVCEELLATGSLRVTVAWPAHPDVGSKFERLGVRYLAIDPNDYDSLRNAGVNEAASLLVLADDDRLNMHIGLKARDLNPSIRLVLRLFNRTLGRKVAQNLSNCSVLSLAAHAAATYAAAALDRDCYYALQFPDIDGPLVGFARRRVTLPIAGLSVRDAQSRLGVKIVDIGREAGPRHDEVLRSGDELTIFGELDVIGAQSATDHTNAPVTPDAGARQRRGHRIRKNLRPDPIVAAFVGVAAIIFLAATGYFAHVFNGGWLMAAYFVVSTMTTVGYGDVTPLRFGRPAMFVAMCLMISGVALGGIAIAFISSALTRTQWVRMQGLRRVRARNHIVVCGSGSVGRTVIDLLLDLGHRVVVIERKPDPLIVELARSTSLDVLTGDATHDESFDMCEIDAARSLIALTDSDTSNLEVALSGRARNAKFPVVMRVMDPFFARSIARHFQLDLTFSTAELAAPAFAGLALLPGMRGRITLGSHMAAIVERPGDDRPAESGAVALGIWTGGRFRLAEEGAHFTSGDLVLYAIPAGPPPQADEA